MNNGSAAFTYGRKEMLSFVNNESYLMLYHMH